MNSRPINSVASIVIASVALLASPAEQAHSDSIVTDGDVVVDGASFLALRSLACQNAQLHGTAPLPPICILGAGERFIFATSTTSTAGGNLVQWANNLLTPATFTDGLDAGDAICQKHADDAGLQGSYTAWLSTDTVDAKDRIGDHTLIRRDGLVVADDKAQLLSCDDIGNQCLQNAIETENSTPFTHELWTGTDRDGAAAQGGGGGFTYDCDSWTSSLNGDIGQIGYYGNNTFNWTEGELDPCDSSWGLICFQK